jgi:hypothetical protein
MSTYGKFAGKGYEYGGLFYLSLLDLCTEVINHVCNDNESNIWHSQFCHINFICITRLANLSLIPKIY